MITRLSHVTIYVTDQERALEFYRDKLGFEVRADFPMGESGRWLTVGPRSQPDLEIILYTLGSGGMIDEETVGLLRKVLERGAMGTGVFEVDDCRATYKELSARGVEFISPPQDQPYGVEAIMKDPFGNWFSMTQHR